MSERIPLIQILAPARHHRVRLFRELENRDAREGKVVVGAFWKGGAGEGEEGTRVVRVAWDGEVGG